MKFLRQLASVLVSLSLILIPIAHTGATGLGSTLVSLGNNNALPDGQSASTASATPDGRYVVFNSQAGNLVPNFTPQVVNGSTLDQVYLHDRITGSTSLLSTNSDGDQANAGAGNAIISANGRYVVFTTTATNLGFNNPSNGNECYVRDLQLGTINAVLPNSTSSGASECWGISADGNYIGITGDMNYPWPGYTCPSFPCSWGSNNDYVFDRSANVIRPVGIDSNGNYGNVSDSIWHGYHTNRSTISDDGNMVAFTSSSALVPSVTAGQNHIYVRNMSAGTVQLITSANEAADNWNSYGTISNDGQYVAHLSLVADGSKYNMYLRNLADGTDVQVDSAAVGYTNYNAVISPDDRYVAFDASPVFRSGTGEHVYVKDLLTGTTTLSDTNANGQPADGSSSAFQVLANGAVLFETQSSNLVAGVSTAQVYLAPSPTPQPLRAINAGGGAVGSFATDSGFLGGSTYTSSATVDTSGVSSPAPQGVYQSVRYGDTMGYTLSGLTPNASYTLRLDFNEPYWGTSQANGGGVGSRVFNVAVNGQPALTNFDIYQQAGGANKAIAEQIPVTASSTGEVTVQFTSVADNAIVSGIELYTSGTAPSQPTPPTPIPVTSALINTGGNTAGDFVADNDFLGGSTFASTAAVDTSGVTNPAPQTVYQSARYGNFSYNVPNLTPNTSFLVKLHFNELYWGTSLASGSGGIGSRVFNVAVNGSPALTNYDVYQAAGGANKAITETFPATSDAHGKITIQFTSVVDNAMVNGIEIVPPTSL